VPPGLLFDGTRCTRLACYPAWGAHRLVAKSADNLPVREDPAQGPRSARDRSGNVP